jgi:trans-2,3-dihydro-3-hydroxyanthranilate isomerase
MRHGEVKFGPALGNREGFARALGLEASDLLAGQPICTGSTGSAFLYIPLRDRETVDRARLDVPALLAAQGEGPKLGVFVFAPDPAPDPDSGAGRVYSRMFAPHTSGVPEDPATGSASGPLGAYLVERGLVARAEAVNIVSAQGVKMGRPSAVHIRVGMREGRVSEILVGGGVVPVIDGRLRVS